MRIEDLREEFKTIYKYENIILKKGKKERETFQRLEFLGDKVLALVLSSVLFDEYKNFSEGRLSRVVAYLCSGKVLFNVALDIKLDIFLKHKKKKFSEKVLVDCMEVIIGAFYIHNGFNKTKKIILNLWKYKIKNINKIEVDSKTTLQEWSQSKKLGLPKYSLVDKNGPDHNPLFTVKVHVKNYEYKTGKGKTRQDAEQSAAKQLLKNLKLVHEKKINSNY